MVRGRFLDVDYDTCRGKGSSGQLNVEKRGGYENSTLSSLVPAFSGLLFYLFFSILF